MNPPPPPVLKRELTNQRVFMDQLRQSNANYLDQYDIWEKLPIEPERREIILNKWMKELRSETKDVPPTILEGEETSEVKTRETHEDEESS